MRRLGAAGLVLTTALVLAGCGADDRSSPPPDGAAGPTSPTDTASPSPSPPPATSSSGGGATASPSTAAALVAPELATGPQDLARRLVAAEDLVRDPAAPAAEVAQAAFDTQVLYRQLARTPAWQPRVLDAAGRYRATVADHLEARAALRSVLTDLSSTLPAWRIRRPAPLDRLVRFYRAGERVHGVPWEVLAAVNFVETGFGKIRGLSSAGARGPMQFMPATWDAYGGGDIDDPRDAILAAARYLAASGGARSGGLDDALHAYNPHQGYVRGIRAYARILERDPAALEGLYRWQVLYLSRRGDVWLPIGYLSRTSLPVGRYLARHPDRLLSTSTD